MLLVVTGEKHEKSKCDKIVRGRRDSRLRGVCLEFEGGKRVCRFCLQDDFCLGATHSSGNDKQVGNPVEMTKGV